MVKKVITISREYGSGGRAIGKEVAEKLGIPYYDKEMIAKIVEKSGLAEEFVENRAEYSPQKSLFTYSFIGRDATGSSIDDYLYRVQREMILKVADEGPCVIIGRCADYILKQKGYDVLNVFICGDEDVKSEHLQKKHGISDKEARKRMRSLDKRRSINYRYYTDEEWGKASNYALCLNSSELGAEFCVKLICTASEEEETAEKAE